VQPIVGERRGPGAQALRFGAVAFVLLCLIVLNVDPVMGHWHRYFSPMLPIMVVTAVSGLRYLGRIARSELAVARSFD
jgi:hypothetical protein